VQETESAPVENPRPPTGVWTRIREHKMPQWGTAYLGAALAVAQGTELLAAAFDWPASANQIVLVLLVIGFPIALTIAWYHGHRGLRQMSQGELAIVSVLLLIGAIFFTVSIRPSPGTLSQPDPARASAETNERADDASAPPYSIAVLPFVNLSSDSEQEYFADGLSEELLNQMAKIEQLLVTARTSSFAYKGRTGDVATIGRELRVRHVLEGSVRKAGNQLRITAQLIDTSTGFHVWSNDYNRELADVFALQEEIARSVADALQVTLGIGRDEFRAGGTQNAVAYDHYLLAQSLFRQRTQDRDDRARAELEQALMLDPEFGLAQIALAQLLIRRVSNTWQDGVDELAVERDRAIERAFRIAPDVPEASWLNALRNMANHDWSAAEQSVQRMWALSSPNDYAANVNYGVFLQRVGYAREALPYAQRARVLDPLVAEPYTRLSLAFDALAEHERAVASYRDMLANAAALGANDIAPHLLRTLANSDVAAAQKALDETCRAFPDTCTGLRAAFQIVLGDRAQGLAELRSRYEAADNAPALAVSGLFAAQLGDLDLAIEAFRRGVLRDQVWLMFAWIPTMEPVRRDPRFKDLMTEVKLVDYWRATRWPDRCRALGERDFECF
jgi:TolB-like protein